MGLFRVSQSIVTRTRTSTKKILRNKTCLIRGRRRHGQEKCGPLDEEEDSQDHLANGEGRPQRNREAREEGSMTDKRRENLLSLQVTG